MCRFYCCLAAHQRTRKKDSAEPSFPILWTPPHPPGGVRCGGASLLPRVWSNLGSLYPVLSLIPSSECCAAICVRLCIVRVSVDFVGFVSFVFHWWWDGLFVPAATVGFAIVFCWITADRAISSNFVWCKLISPIAPGERMFENAFVRLRLQENGYPVQAKPLTIQVIPYRLHSFPYSLSY